MKKHCGECAKLKSELCDQPDQCVQGGYKYFSRSKPYKKCEDCGGPMRRIRTDNPSRVLVITDLECSWCGLKAEERREYIRKTPARV